MRLTDLPNGGAEILVRQVHIAYLYGCGWIFDTLAVRCMLYAAEIDLAILDEPHRNCGCHVRRPIR